MLTIAEIAEDLTREGFTEDMAANRLRRFRSQKIIKPTARMGDGPTAPWVYPACAPAVARLLFFVHDMGIWDKAVLASLWDGLTTPERAGDPLPIERILRDIAEGGAPKCIITAFVDPDEGNLVLHGAYRLSSNLDEPIMCPTDQHERYAHTVIELSRVLSDFVIKRSEAN